MKFPIFRISLVFALSSFCFGREPLTGKVAKNSNKYFLSKIQKSKVGERDVGLTNQSAEKKKRANNFLEKSYEEVDSREGHYLQPRRNRRSNLQSRSFKYIPLNSLTLLKHHQMKNGEGAKNKLWWEDLPAKRKDKNKIILDELDKLRESVPDWPWLGNNSFPGLEKISQKTEIEMNGKDEIEMNGKDDIEMTEKDEMKMNEKDEMKISEEGMGDKKAWLVKSPSVMSSSEMDIKNEDILPMKESVQGQMSESKVLMKSDQDKMSSPEVSLMKDNAFPVDHTIEDVTPMSSSAKENMKQKFIQPIENPTMEHAEHENKNLFLSQIQLGENHQNNEMKPTLGDDMKVLESNKGQVEKHSPGIPSWPWLVDSDQDVAEKDEENNSQVPDWSWLINNFGEKDENATEEDSSTSSHDDDLEIDITPYMFKQKQTEEQKLETEIKTDWLQSRTENFHEDETMSSIFPDWFLNAFSSIDSTTPTPTTPETTPTTLTTTYSSLTTTHSAKIPVKTTITSIMSQTNLLSTTTSTTKTMTTTNKAKDSTKTKTDTMMQPTMIKTALKILKSTARPGTTTTVKTTTITSPTTTPITTDFSSTSTTDRTTTMLVTSTATSTTVDPVASEAATSAITVTLTDTTTTYSIAPKDKTTVMLFKEELPPTASTTTASTTTASTTTASTAPTTTTTMKDEWTTVSLPDSLKKSSLRLQQSEQDEQSPWKRPIPKIKLNANRIYINRQKNQQPSGFSSAEPVIKIDPTSLSPDTGKNSSQFDLNFFPLKENSETNVEPLKFPSLSQLEKEESTPRIPIPPHSPAETRETFDHLATLYATRSPSIYHNKVASAIYVAESSGIESQVQGVNILMKDEEKVPMTIDEKLQTTNNEKLQTPNDEKLQITNDEKLQITNEEKLPMANNTAGSDVITSVEATTEVGSTQVDEEIFNSKEDLSEQPDNPVSTTVKSVISSGPTGISKPAAGTSKPENSGIISHIQRLIELNTSMMETIQAQLAAQGNILKSLIEATLD